MKKHSAVLIALSLAVSVGLSACNSDNAKTNSESDGGKTTQISWSFWNQGDEMNKIWTNLANDASKDGVSVKLMQTPFADYFTKLQSQLAGDSAPCIISMQSLRLPTFKDALIPLDDVLSKGYLDQDKWDKGSLVALQADGKQYAVPFGMSSLILYYNKSIFEEAGVPEPKMGWTVDEFVTAAKTITEKTGKPAFGQSFSDLHMFSLLHAYNGAEPVNSKGELNLLDPKMKEAFTWYTSLATKEKISSVPASSSDIPWGEQQFLAGNVAMAVDGTWNVSSNETDVDFPVGVVTLPIGPEGAGSFAANSGFGISASCKYKEEAAKVLETITSEEAAKEQAKLGSLPARLVAQDLFYDTLKDSTEEKSPGYSQNSREIMTASSQKATPFIPTEKWDQITKKIARNFLLAYTGTDTPEQSLAKVQEGN